MHHLCMYVQAHQVGLPYQSVPLGANERKAGQKRSLTVLLNLQYLFNPLEDTAEETGEEDVVAVSNHFH